MSRGAKPGEWNASTFGMADLSIHDEKRSSRSSKSSSTKPKSEKNIDELKEEAGAKRQQKITQYLKTAQQVSILFMFDATSSMHSKIQLVKDQCEAMFKHVVGEYSMVRIKAAVVAYRDFDCGDNHTEVLDFTGDTTKFKDFLRSVKAIGGADAPEDIFTGIQKAGDLTWKNGTNIVLHIADAPCHGKKFHKLADDYPDGDPKGRNLSELLNKLYHEHRVVKYFFSHLNNHTVQMIKEFKKAAPQPDWIEEDHVGNDDALVEFLVGSILSSVGASLSTPSFDRTIPRAPTKNYTIGVTEAELWPPAATASWGGSLTGRNYLHEVCDISDIHSKLKNGGHLQLAKKFSMKLEIARKPFSDEGMCRYPFHAVWLNAPSGKHSNGKTIFKDRRMVVKEFKREYEYFPWIGKIDLTTLEAYEMQSEIQAVSNMMARAFNKAARDIPGIKTIKFPQVYTVEMDQSAVEKGCNRYYNMEVLLKDRSGGDGHLDFMRFTNNAGAVTRKAREHPYGDTVLAFSHFTFDHSSQHLMVTDLQGAFCKPSDDEKAKEQFTLSDPMIHSDRYFLRAPGNFGKRGVEAFFQTHECNDICRALKLVPKELYCGPSSSSSSSRSSGGSSGRGGSSVSGDSRPCVSSASSYHSTASSFGSYMSFT